MNHFQKSSRFVRLFAALLLTSASCTQPMYVPDEPNKDVPVTTPLPALDTSIALNDATNSSEISEKKPLPAKTAAAAPSESPRLKNPDNIADLVKKTETYFNSHQGQRVYIQTDKPLYKPGETVWIKAWDLQNSNLSRANDSANTVQLISPKGAVVLQKRVTSKKGISAVEFDIPAEVQGGEYQLRLISSYSGVTSDRPIIVSTYEAPRIKKKLEFTRKAYGEGDEVNATIEVKRPTGEALGNLNVVAAIRLDGVDLPRATAKTDADGNALIKFTLPKSIAVGDGLLTVLVEDGGVTESVSKSIPIILKKLQFSMFPEGGKLVQGVPSRLYFEAKNTIGKPADVEGQLVDDHGNAVAKFETYKNGMGRLDFTPQTGRTYKAKITKPIGITEEYAIAIPQEDGCVLRTFDDYDSELPVIRAQVICTESKTVTIVGVIRDQLIDAATVAVQANIPSVIYLKPSKKEHERIQGVVRLTVFDEKLLPVAERIVFRGRRSALNIKISQDKGSYSPRETVALKIQTTDIEGKPVAADVGMAVVDDTVLSFADDKTGHMLSRVFLENDVPGKVEEPNFYFDLTEEKSAVSMDLLMGTRGFRSFEWQTVLNPPPPQPVYAALGGGWGGEDDDMAFAEGAVAMDAAPMPRKMAMRGDMRPQAAMMKVPGAKPQEEFAPVAPPPPAPKGGAIARAPAMAAAAEMAAPRDAEKKNMMFAPPVLAKPIEIQERMKDMVAAEPMAKMKMDADWGGGKAMRQEERRMAPPQLVVARVFPTPSYTPDYSGPRSDFRETIYWNPSVTTDSSGTAKVSFSLSDAVTSFRISSEGIGNGFAGRNETVLKSNLPFSVNAKLPVEVSAGDQLLIPLTLTNEKNSELNINLQSLFGSLTKLEKSPDVPKTLAAKARQTFYYPLAVTGNKGASDVQFKATASGLNDELNRTLTVVPVGFPQVFSKSGTSAPKGSSTSIDIDLGQALPKSAELTVNFYPSPIASMTSGLEGLLREPSGCFEQTSSTNYPNVMILQYLKQNNITDPALWEKSGKLIESGYRRLTGFETPQKGYEWFGGAPGHEALSAYGLLEFADMKAIYGNVDDAMMQRTSKWLKSRRDGKGGFLRDPKALDSFGGASPEVTNAYITYSLAQVRDADIKAEVDALIQTGKSTSDEYILALAAGAALTAPGYKAQGLELAKKLASAQQKDGSWTKASQSITRSGGDALTLETTSLATLALIDAGSYDANTRLAVDYLNKHRSGFGQWGSTQSTVLTLKALTAYAKANAQTKSPGTIAIVINGKEVAQQSYVAGRKDTLVFSDMGQYLVAGKNSVQLVTKDGETMPFAVAAEFRSAVPATSEKAKIDLKTTLERDTMKMGETVRINATITNKTAEGQPMTLARIGIPGGLSFQTWQLKELREKGLISFYETRAREVILYFRDMKPSENKVIPIDLVATVPGTYTAPASSAYLYYTNEDKTWTPAVKVQISP